jgi:adenylate kinase family enzyme
MASMDRVMVVGTSCSGKTTVARRLSAILGAPHVELDALHWGPGWTECPPEEFTAAVRQRTAADRWVVDGNYRVVRPVVMERATDVVWLNYPFALVFARSLRRTWRRVVTGEELFGGNRETFAAAFLSRYSIPWWVLRTHRRRAREYRELFTGLTVPHVTELGSQSDADSFLQALASKRTALPRRGRSGERT